MATIFWISLFAIFYAYIGYPLSLYVISISMSRKNSAPLKSSNHYHYVSLLISAYNEEGVIEDKILNSLALNYPKDLFEIVIISDGSDDRTEEIVRKFEKEGVSLKSYEGRLGKSSCLNKTVPLCKGDIIVFSDANSKYDNDSLIHLLKKFNDPRVGLVTGSTNYISKGSDKRSMPVGIYSKIEKITKKIESNISSCVGADGAIFAIRKKLYQPLKNYDINDFVIPLNIIRQGYRVVLAENAFCVEETAKEISGEFKRQTRITNRTLRAIFNNSDMLNPFKFGIFSFELISHKLLKFMAPYFMIFFLVANILIVTSNIIYTFILSGQTALYMLGLIGYCYKLKTNKPRLIEMSQTFISINIAILLGWITYFKGVTYTTWSSSR